MEAIIVGIVFAMVAITLSVVVAWLVIIIIVFAGGFIDSYMQIQKTIISQEYECKNEFRKWINFLRYIRYIADEVIIQASYDLGYFIGDFATINLGKVTVFKRFKTFLIYSKKDTCKETKWIHK